MVLCKTSGHPVSEGDSSRHVILRVSSRKRTERDPLRETLLPRVSVGRIEGATGQSHVDTVHEPASDRRSITLERLVTEIIIPVRREGVQLPTPGVETYHPGPYDARPDPGRHPRSLDDPSGFRRS